MGLSDRNPFPLNSSICFPHVPYPPRGLVTIGDVGDALRGLFALPAGPGVDVVQRLAEVAEIEAGDGHVVPTEGLLRVAIARCAKSKVYFGNMVMRISS